MPPIECTTDSPKWAGEASFADCYYICLTLTWLYLSSAPEHWQSEKNQAGSCESVLSFLWGKDSFTKGKSRGARDLLAWTSHSLPLPDRPARENWRGSFGFTPVHFTWARNWESLKALWLTVVKSPDAMTSFPVLCQTPKTCLHAPNSPARLPATSRVGLQNSTHHQVLIVYRQNDCMVLLALQSPLLIYCGSNCSLLLFN